MVDLHGLYHAEDTCPAKTVTIQYEGTFLKKTTLEFTTSSLWFALWVVSIPTNLFYKILPNYGFVDGLQIDYLIPKLYFSDLCAIAFVAAFLFPFFKAKKVWPTIVSALNTLKKKTTTFQLFLLLCGSLIVFSIRQLFTPFPIAALWFCSTSLLHIITATCAIQWCSRNTSKLLPLLFFALTSTVVLQSGVGLFQFGTQKSVNGFLFFGEPQLRFSQSLTKGDFAGIDTLIGTHLGYRVLPYGTTAHPNILAGFLVVSLWSVLALHLTKHVGSTLVVVATTCIALLCIALTLSLTAFAGVVCAALWLWIYTKSSSQSAKAVLFAVSCLMFFILPLILPMLSNWTHHTSSSIERRIMLNRTATQIFLQKPLMGIGAYQWTALQEKYSVSSESVRFVQPAHHVGLLFLAENGLLGLWILSLFILLMAQLTQHTVKLFVMSFCLLAPFLTADHFLITIHTGQWLVVLIWIVSVCIVNGEKKVF